MTKMACESTFHESPVLVDVTVFEREETTREWLVRSQPTKRSVTRRCSQTGFFFRMAIIRSYDLSLSSRIRVVCPHHDRGDTAATTATRRPSSVAVSTL